MLILITRRLPSFLSPSFFVPPTGVLYLLGWSFDQMSADTIFAPPSASFRVQPLPGLPLALSRWDDL